MCGVAGFWRAPLSDADGAALRRMTDAVRHRGPDDEGHWCDPDAGIALGHRRLAILDLSATGHQPMVSGSGRYVIVFNGEIYNFQDLRAELEQAGGRFRGHSDTEVLLAAIERWSPTGALQRAAGMFAFALWDRTSRTLFLARDRLGEKPLYYGWMGNTLLFGSELKALRAHPAWHGEIDRDALALYVRYGYVPAPYSIYRDIRKMLPGTLLKFRSPATQPQAIPFWSARDAFEAGRSHSVDGSEPEVIAALDAVLRRAVRQQMISDAPLGAFLSGGVDSSTVAALMQAEAARPVRTFTIGFHELGFNEAEHAKAVARHLGTDHTELYVTPAETRAVIPRLPVLYDEPFADSSQIPTALVAELARREVTVSLSGDGADELFAGYKRYFLGNRLWRSTRCVPAFVRRVAAWGMAAAPPGVWGTGDRLPKLSGILTARTAERMYQEFVSVWREPGALVRGGAEPLTCFTDERSWLRDVDPTPRMMYLDLVGRLPDQYLVKVDRAAMGASLESRAPFLDHRVVEFAWRIPHRLKVRRGRGKWILRQLLYRYVPAHLVDRPKTGFGVPLNRWLRGPLREWAGDLLSPARIAREGFLDPDPIAKRWAEHVSGRRAWANPLWVVLMFQAWLETQ